MGLFGKEKKSDQTKCKECGLELHQPERLERHMKKAHGMYLRKSLTPVVVFKKAVCGKFIIIKF